MLGTVEMENLAAAVMDHKQAVQYAEIECDDSEEIHTDNHLPVIAEKGPPALSAVAVAVQTRQIARRCARRLEHLTSTVRHGCGVRPRCSFRVPFSGSWLESHSKCSASGFLGPRAKSPIGAKRLPMPRDHGLRLND